MIDQFDPQSHVGEQPIRVLQHIITYWLHNVSEDFRSISLELARRGSLNLGIKYKIGCDPINSRDSYGNANSPYIHDGVICVHETFLSYLWCIGYALSQTHENVIRNPRFDGKSGPEILQADESIRGTLNTILKVFTFGTSLINEFRDWDKDNLPNPERFSKEHEETIGKVNGVFVAATSFVMCHEVAHSYLEHLEKRMEHYKQQGKVDSALLKKQEREADLKAVEWLLSGSTGDDDLYTKKIGIIVGTCSLLFLSNVCKQPHPSGY